MFGKIFTLAPCKETDKMFANLKIKLTDKPTLKGYTPVKKLFRDLKKKNYKESKCDKPSDDTASDSVNFYVGFRLL